MTLTRAHINSEEGKAAMAGGWGLYCGRAVPRRKLAGSEFGNPFKIGSGDVKTREDAINSHRIYWQQQEALQRRLAGCISIIMGEHHQCTLLCWCNADEACHCDVLIEGYEKESANGK